jgi:hypothetical protein
VEVDWMHMDGSHERYFREGVMAKSIYRVIQPASERNHLIKLIPSKTKNI